MRSVLNRKLVQAKTRKATLVNRWLDGDTDQQTYREHIARLTTEIEEVGSEIRSTDMEHIEVEGVLEFVDDIILRPARLVGGIFACSATAPSKGTLP